MPKGKKKKQYTEIKNRTVYLIRNPLSREFYIGHTTTKNLRSTYKDHYIGAKYKTSIMVEDVREQGLKPCFIALETIDSTAVQTYRYVIAWTKFFLEHGFDNLDHGNVITYANNLQPETEVLFKQIENTNLSELLYCKNCLFPDYARFTCPILADEEEEEDTNAE